MLKRLPILWIVVILTLALGVLSACGSEEPAGEVTFMEPSDGAEVESPFLVRMGTEGVSVESAGQVREGYGHHHIIIDADLPPLDRAIPSDANHRHFGKGQTEAVLDLEPGEHTLSLLFAKGDHIPYNAAITDTVKVNVTERRRAFFIEPQDGAQVTSPFTVRMEAVGVTVEPASEGVNEGTGHHHIIIDTDLPPGGQPIPGDDQHRHFGKGQTETTLDLPPGEHTLRLLFAQGNHVPYGPPITDTVKITVVE